MQYNDENTNLTEPEWQQMAREYENAFKLETVISAEIGDELNLLFHDLLMAYPNLSELNELNVAIQSLVNSSNNNATKKSFFSPSLNSINKRMFEISKRLLDVSTSSISNKINNVLIALFVVGEKINNQRKNKW